MNEEKKEHPSYCLVSFSRCNSSHPITFVNSMVKSNSYILLKIKTAAQRRSVSKTWFYEKDSIVELRLSPNQFSELLTNMNCDGVTGTLEWVNSERIPEPPMENEIELHKQEIVDQTEKTKSALNNLMKFVETVKLTKKEKNQFKDIVSSLRNSVVSNIPFVIGSAFESIQKTVVEAKGCIDSFYQGLVTRLGLKVIEKGMIPEILYEPEEKKEELK